MPIAQDKLHTNCYPAAESPKKGASDPIGLLKKGDGTFTQCFRDTEEFLQQTHFPDSVAVAV